jgi:hypothetical protein
MQLVDPRINRYRVGQQPASAVSVVAGANRDLGQPSQERGVKSILKKDHGVETPLLQDPNDS